MVIICKICICYLFTIFDKIAETKDIEIWETDDEKFSSVKIYFLGGALFGILAVCRRLK